ncbi:putative short-chain dehydrogenase [Bipolaris maydis]|nr:putative short-chain dehydrogenase [Bipolaris maydis]
METSSINSCPNSASEPQRYFRKAGYLILASLVLRFEKYLSRRAMNNGVSDTYSWEKEIVVVTGGAGGIGGELVKQLATKGTRIAVLDVLPLSYSKPSNVEYFKCDLTDSDSLTAAADRIRAKWGHPTVLCCIAGILRGKALVGVLPPEAETFGVNAIGLALCYKEFVPAMFKANHGHVVTMSSATAYSTVSCMADYAASKSAALALHEGLQTELKHIYKAPKVRCTVVCPSLVGTKMFTGLSSPSNFLMPVLTPQEVAGVISSALWSGEARHIDLPWLSKVFMTPLKGAPVFLRMLVQDGAGDSMHSFDGHKVIN